MRRNRFLLATALCTAAPLAGGTVAKAQDISSVVPDDSAQDLRDLRAFVLQMIDELGSNRQDYRGLRSQALAKLLAAKDELAEALAARRVSPDWSLRAICAGTEHCIEDLKREGSDNGHVTTAIAELQEARDLLEQVLVMT